MKLTITYAKFADAINEFERLKKMPATMKILIGDRLEKFIKRNDVYYKSMNERINAIMEDCVNKTESGEWERVMSKDKEDKPLQKWDFKSPEHEEDYNKRLKELLEQSITIEV